MSSKYAALPDLDQSQDIYETPDLTDDVSTVPTSASPAHSDIDISDLPSPTSAHRKFRHAILDASNTDFSDRISNKRRSYAASSRRKPKPQTYGDLSDDDIVEEEGGSEGEPDETEERFGGETVEKKMARLKREIEELKGLVEAKEEEEDEGRGGEETGERKKGVEELVEALKALGQRKGEASSAQKRLAGRIADATTGPIAPTTATPVSTTIEKPIPTSDSPAAPLSSTYTITYAPTYTQTHTLSKITEFDDRLATLEHILGLPYHPITSLDLPLPGPSSDPSPLPTHAIIPTLNDLSAKLQLLTTSFTPTTLDAATRRAKLLTVETEKLIEARKTASKLPPTSPGEEGSALSGGAEGAGLEADEATVAKINALYGLLPGIEKMAPLLPAVLVRLKSLKGVHMDAARAAGGLKEVEEEQARLAEELKKWEEAVGKMETVVREGVEKVGVNVEMVEGWVRALEERVEKLG